MYITNGFYLLFACLILFYTLFTYYQEMFKKLLDFLLVTFCDQCSF